MPQSDHRTKLASWQSVLMFSLLWATHQQFNGSVSSEPSEIPSAPEGILWSGCAEVRFPVESDDPNTCIVRLANDRDAPRPQLRIWVPSSVSEPKVFFDGAPLALEHEVQVDSGWSFAVSPDHRGRLSLGGVVDEVHIDLLTLDLEIRPHLDRDLKRALDAALHDDEAQTALLYRWQAELEAADSDSQRLRFTRFLSYLHFDRGNWPKSATLAEKFASMAQALGRPMAECDAAASAAYIHHHHLANDTKAAKIDEEYCDAEAAIPEIRMRGLYYRGLSELRREELLEARRSIENSVMIARRLRLSRWERIEINALVDVLAAQGRFQWARSLLERSSAIEDSAEPFSEVERCESMVYGHDKRGELAYREARLTRRPTVGAREHWLRAIEVYADREICPEHPSTREMIAVVIANLVRVALDEGELVEATRRLDTIDIDAASPANRFRYSLLHVELELARGALSRARRELDDLDDLDDQLARNEPSTARPRERWRYHLLRARLEDASDAPKLAVTSLRLAQSVLAARTKAAGSGAEPDRHAAMYRESGQMLVRLLLEQGQLESSLCVARLTRVRGLLGPRYKPVASASSTRVPGTGPMHEDDIPIDERIDAAERLHDTIEPRAEANPTLGCSDLPKPAQGELSLLPFLDDVGWVAFAWNSSGDLAARRLARAPTMDDPEILGKLLLSPFEDLLRDATRLRVVIPSALQHVNMPDLVVDGQPIGDTKAVVFAVDLPPAARIGHELPQAVLVFSDPHRGFGNERDRLGRRFDQWTSTLKDAGLRVPLHKIPPPSEPISLDEVLLATTNVELALLYGFGGTQWNPHTGSTLGAEPDQNTFDLGATGLLRIDILRQTGHVPRHVILAHCDSAKVDPFGISGATGLAQSYIQAGSEWSLGTAGTVPTASMEMVVGALISAYPLGSDVNEIAAVLRKVQHRLRSEGLPEGGKFRIWIP